MWMCWMCAQVVEQGTHEELMAIPDGTYRTLVGLQARHTADIYVYIILKHTL
jgi:hypothetical protein